MGLELNQQPAHRDSLPLQRAVLRWTKRNYALLRQRNPEVADKCLVAGMSFDEEYMRIVKCYPSKVCAARLVMFTSQSIRRPQHRHPLRASELLK
jgi:hypothetical protein